MRHPDHTGGTREQWLEGNRNGLQVPRNFSSALLAAVPVFSEVGITELGDLGTAVGRPHRTKGCKKIELTHILPQFPFYLAARAEPSVSLTLVWYLHSGWPLFPLCVDSSPRGSQPPESQEPLPYIVFATGSAFLLQGMGIKDVR